VTKSAGGAGRSDASTFDGIEFDETYWCVWSTPSDRLDEPERYWAPCNFVGVKTWLPRNTTDPQRHWTEKIDPEALHPKNLFEAQRERR